LYNLAQVLFDHGDEVIIPAPYWVSYPDIVALAGGHSVIVDTQEKDGFKMKPEQLKSAITKHTKAVIINSPSNPAGAAYTPEELKAIAAVLLDKDILIISDDIYEKIYYAEFPFTNIAACEPKLKDRIIVVNGISKTYAMTGWRIGYAAGPEEIAAAMNKIQSQNTSNPTSIAQKAAVEALCGDQKIVDKMVSEFRKRKDYIVHALEQIPRVKCFLLKEHFMSFLMYRKFMDVLTKTER